MEYYIGIDVGKAQLDIDWCDEAKSCSNSDLDIEVLISDLLALKANDQLALVICEATGGYEQKFVQACYIADIPVHVAHPNKVRNFAKSKGLKAKTDKIDAKLLSDYARLYNVEADVPLLNKTTVKIGQLLRRREQLISNRQQERNRIDKIICPDILESINDHIGWLNNQINQITKQLSLLKKSAEVNESHDLLTSIPSIGDLTAHYLLANLPEIGNTTHKKLAALVGVAPFNRDSGKGQGKRFICGGRSHLRRILYMCAITAIRKNHDLSQFYIRLRANGKAAKVAIIAVVRKLLTMANSVMTRRSPWEVEYGI